MRERTLEEEEGGRRGADGSGWVESTDDREASSVEEGSWIVGRLRLSFGFSIFFH